jgi:hypothetical protein
MRTPGLEHPHLYQLMFQEDLPLTFANSPESTPGRQSFENLLSAVRRCLDAGVCRAHDDPFRLALLVWAAEHGLVLARISRPSFPWADIDSLVNEMVTRMMALNDAPALQFVTDVVGRRDGARKADVTPCKTYPRDSSARDRSEQHEVRGQCCRSPNLD